MSFSLRESGSHAAQSAGFSLTLCAHFEPSLPVEDFTSNFVLILTGTFKSRIILDQTTSIGYVVVVVVFYK